MGNPAVVRVSGFDHLVLRSRDVEGSLRFYCDTLGLRPERVDQWRRGQAPFPSVRIDSTTIIDILAGEPDGINVDHLCLVVADADLAATVATGAFDVLEGPVRRWGAQGEAMSIYVRDPDGNVVELRHYG